MPDDNIKKLTYKNYIRMIENSIGTKMFKNLFIKFLDTQKEIDVLKNGKLSCALYVSSILYLFGLLNNPHTTINSVISDMKESKWKRTKKPQKGDVIVWGKDSDGYEHIGFWWNKKEAVSNSSKKGNPIKHHLTFNNKRKIITVYTRKIEKISK